MSDALKITIKGLVGCGLTLLTFSCEADFTPYTNADPIPVVYAIINPDDSLYYIRLTKTFQCTSNTNQCAKLPMAQYFDHPTVEFELLTTGGKLLNRGFLEPMVAPQKEPGFFSQEPNIIYGIPRGRFEFEQNHTSLGNSALTCLILKIKTTETSHLTYSKVTVGHQARIKNPLDHLEHKFDLFDQRMESITWYGWSNEFNKVIFRVGYTEYLADTVRNDFFDVDFSVDPADLTINGTVFYVFPVDGQDFLKKIKLWYKDKQEPVGLEYRKITSLDILVVSINDDYRLYTNALKRDANVDIVEPSNIINGIGLFAVKRIATSSGHSFIFETMDSIANSQLTKHLKFVKW
jgi:hypothetical protein